MMITFEQNNVKFNFRVAGIAVHDNRVLLHTTMKDDFWNLPGGRVEFNEATDAALAREVEEELGVRAEVGDLVYVNEDFFEYGGKSFHELGFYYLCSFPEDHEITKKTGEFYGIEDGGRLIFKWFAFEELEELHMYPERLKTDIAAIVQRRTIQHHICRQI